MDYKFNELRDEEDMTSDRRHPSNRNVADARQESIPLSMEFQYTQKDSP